MAAEYYRRISETLCNEGTDAAERWNTLAQSRLPEPYRQHLVEWGRALSSLREPRTHSDPFHLQAGISLGAWGAPKNPGGPPSNPPLPRLDVAWLFAYRGDFATALSCLAGYERERSSPQWSKDLAEHRKDMELFRDSGDLNPDLMSKLAWRVQWAGQATHAAVFSALSRLRTSMALEPQAAKVQAGAAYLRAIKDEAGARAWEDLLFAWKGMPQDELASIILTRSNQAFERGDYAAADEGYRRILRDWPQSKMMGRALYNLGKSLQKQDKFKEAREAFEKLLAADVNDNEMGDSIMELRRNYKPKSVVELGECYEAEENWEKALEAYRDQAKHPMRSFCGNCSESMGLASITRIARVLTRLGRDDEAMAECRRALFHSGGIGMRNSELAFLATDIAVRQGSADAFEKELEAASGNANARLALDYLRVLRWRAAGDHRRLFDVMRAAGGIWPDNSGWKEVRRRSPVAMEAAACLGDMGDTVFDWLCEKVRTNSDKGLALIAIANFKTERALEVIRSLPVRPHTNDAWEIRQYESLHAEARRLRRYPPPRIQKQDMGLGLTGVLSAFVIVSVFEVRRRRRSQSQIA
ncbi:MAG TPA: tetratricopeptide repeat protein [Planctomycetota bacterium]|nr:tetratricopeptide repeat protein [Planctomycetota bacterium]